MSLAASSSPAPVAAPAGPTRGESAEHRTLKRLSIEWALAHRFTAVAAEVRLPKSGYRADVAAATPRIAAPDGCTGVFECKASRADFLRDATPEAAARRHALELGQRLVALTAAISSHRPDLRRGESLFPEFDAIDTRGLNHLTLHRLESELRCVQAKILAGVKFDRLMRYRAASLIYLVTDEAFLEPAELPAGWGWLLRTGDTLELRARPFFNETSAEQRVALLERIAAATTAATCRRLGVARPAWRGPIDASPRGSGAGTPPRPSPSPAR